MNTRVLTRILSASLGLLVMAIALKANSQSLYDEDNYSALAQDHRSNLVGDSVTLLIVESSRAQSQADTSANQGLGINANLFDTNRTEVTTVDLGLERNAAGATARQGNLTAQISATITEIDSLGRYFVVGEQEIVVNGEQQVIKASGWLRPVDVGANNTALSTRLSESKIEYKGYGSVGDANEDGYLYWFLKKIGLI